jgi:UPF0716 family protein affecting phage T7 exclusion
LVQHLLGCETTGAVVVHHDARSGPLELGLDDRRLTVLPHPVKVWWAHWSQVEAIVAMLEELVEVASLRWLVLLTGDDWPTVPLEDLPDVLDASTADALIEAKNIEEKWGSWEPRLRYGYRWYKLPAVLQPLFPTMARVLPKLKGVKFLNRYGKHITVGSLGLRRLRRSAITLVGGIEYFIVTPGVASAIIVASKAGSLRRRVLRTFVPTEVFFASAVQQAGFKTSDPRRLMRFSPGEANSDYLTADELRSAAQQGYLFARKVSLATLREMAGQGSVQP